METIDEKIKNAVKIVAESVNKLFARKDHTHTKDNIGIDFSPVAFSGNYGDLSNTPSRQDIGFARNDKAGIVIPGKGLNVGNNGTITVVADQSSGMRVTQDGIGVEMGTGLMNHNNRWCSAITVKGVSWKDIVTELREISQKIYNKGMFEGIRVTVMNTSSYIDRIMRIELTSDRIMNYDSIMDYVSSSIGSVGEIERLFIENCCTDRDETCAYEFLKLMSDGGAYDALVLYLFSVTRMTDKGDMLRKLGMVVPESVLVSEYSNERFEALGIEPPGHRTNMAATYIYTRDGYRDVYNILDGIYGIIDKIS